VADWGEERFRGLLDAAPDALIVTDEKGRIALVNQHAERLFGYGRGDLIGQPVEMLLPLPLREGHVERRRRYLDDAQYRLSGESGGDLAARRKDGTQFPVEVSLSAVDTADGVFGIAALRDTSLRSREVEAQARLASIVQSSHNAIISKNLDGVITSWNPGAVRLYGYQPGEVIGRHSSILFPAEREQEERRINEQVRRGGSIERYRTERLRSDGALVPVSLSASPILDAKGDVTGIATVSEDVGEQERAGARFRGLLEALPDGIVGINEEGEIVLLNAQAERMFGYQREELLGRPLEVLVPDAARGVHQMHRDEYMLNPAPRPMGLARQLTALRKDGSEFPTEISLSSMETSEGLIIAAAIRDVTERLEVQAQSERFRRQAERERLQARLQQAHRLESLGQLAGGVAHDFNNLLAVILNYAAFVKEEVGEAAQAEPERWSTVAKDIEQILRATERGIGLTHQLLAFGRREVVRPRVLSLNSVVAEVQELLRRSIGEHVELVATLEENLWAVNADPGQVEQVLVNLAVNARDAMPGGGTITIDTANITLRDDYARAGGLPAGRYARVRVSDTGVGMPREVVERAFEPFFTTKPKGEGSGLGLATVYGIVTQAGGDVQIYSEPGIGTSINLLLPATDEELSEVEQAESQERPGGGETILVVEDEDAIREVVRRILERHGYEVIIAATGADAIEVVTGRAEPVHLLLTDVVMPQMLGKEVSERVTAVRPEIRVLFMSGYARPVLAGTGTLDPGVELIEKPFSEPVLLAAVRRLLDS
jgi:PAS domain S-box-containing protein